MTGRVKSNRIELVGGMLILFAFCLMSGACGPDPRDVAFLASWSPDGSRAALVPNYVLEEKLPSGLWIYDSRTGLTEQIVSLDENLVCSHPKWSPEGDELLFAVLESPDSEHSDDEGKQMPYSINVVGVDGRNLREVAQSVSAESDFSAFLTENAVMWGPVPGTIIFQEGAGGKANAVELNLETGIRRQFLPGSADAYVIAPSPDRRSVAALLFDEESRLTRLYVADFALANWQLVETLEIAPRRFEEFESIVFWSPDSSCFAVPEVLDRTAGAEKPLAVIRVREARTGALQAGFAADPDSAILWNQESTSIVFSEPSSGGVSRIYCADLSGGSIRLIVSGNDYHLLSWNHEDNRIYFFRAVDGSEGEEQGNNTPERRLFSCAPDGKRAQMLGRLIYDEEDLLWNLSPDGIRIVAFGSPSNAGIVNLTTGELVMITMRAD